MRVKSIVAEDFCNYKHPSMFIVSSICDWKCCYEQGLDIEICQNSPLNSHPSKDIDDEVIYRQFVNNSITKSVVVGGLEPFLQFDELIRLIAYFRSHGENCDFVVYTGYYPDEIKDQLEIMSKYKNIIIKFGRYIPGDNSVYDETLGVQLASKNQFARRIS